MIHIVVLSYERVLTRAPRQRGRQAVRHRSQRSRRPLSTDRAGRRASGPLSGSIRAPVAQLHLPRSPALVARNQSSDTSSNEVCSLRYGLGAYPAMTLPDSLVLPPSFPQPTDTLPSLLALSRSLQQTLEPIFSWSDLTRHILAR